MDSDAECRVPIPLVIVEGFLSVAGPFLWGTVEDRLHDTKPQKYAYARRQVIFVSVGPASSLHDRACELYFALVGGRVNYGENHAREHGHARIGRVHQSGLYPHWSLDHPLHFLGHSIGGPTIIKLQWLISIGFFGDCAHPDMMLSVTTISAPFRGSQVVYTLGEKVDSAPAVRPFSIGAFISRSVHLTAYLSPRFPFLDLHTDARSLAWHSSTFRSFLNNLWRNEWTEGRDAAPFDVTFLASDEREAELEGVLNEHTFYRSYAACMSVQTSDSHYLRPRRLWALFAPALYLLSRAMGLFDFSVIKSSPTVVRQSQSGIDHGIRDSSLVGGGKGCAQLRANDGIVPLFSQWHPFDCRSTLCQHHQFDPSHQRSSPGVPYKSEDTSRLMPGVWHVYHIANAHHLSIAPFWIGTSRQRQFWKELGDWLRAIDSHTTTARAV